MKYYLKLDNENNVVGWCSNQDEQYNTEIDLEELPLYILNGYKYDNGNLVKSELYDSLVARDRIDELKDKLTETDYKVMKYMEGQLDEEDWLIIKSQRQAWRDEINRLENKLKE